MGKLIQQVSPECQQQKLRNEFKLNAIKRLQSSICCKATH